MAFAVLFGLFYTDLWWVLCSLCSAGGFTVVSGWLCFFPLALLVGPPVLFLGPLSPELLGGVWIWGSRRRSLLACVVLVWLAGGFVVARWWSTLAGFVAFASRFIDARAWVCCFFRS